MTDTLDIMMNYSDNSCKSALNPNHVPNTAGCKDVNLAQTTPIPSRGRNGKLHLNTMCNKCGKHCHYADNYSEDSYNEREGFKINSFQHSVNIF